MKSEGELDQSVRPPAPLVDGQLSWVGAYRPPVASPSVPSVRRLARWSLLLRALARGVEVLLGWSVAPPIDAQHAICTRKNICHAMFAEIRGKNIWFSFFFQPELLANSTLGSPMKKSSKKSVRMLDDK